MANDCTNYKQQIILSHEEILKHNSVTDCWVIESGIVYNVTSFLDKHPGGAEVILSKAGTDITAYLANEFVHAHSISAYNLLKQYRIGILDGEKNNIVGEGGTCECSMDGWHEDLVDWNKGMVRQVHKFGKDYLKWVHSPVNKKLRLFDSDFIEVFSKTPWYMVPLVWIPVVIIVSLLSIQELNMSCPFKYEYAYVNKLMVFGVYLVMFSLGLPMWTFMEYVLHRYLFHLEPRGDSPFMITLHFFLHGQHHKVPFDNMRLVFPPVAAAFVIFLFHGLIVWLIPWGLGRALCAGALLGYIFYDLLHYYLHHGEPTRGGYLHSLKYYHVLHHFDDHNTGYGISTRFWDYPFSTVNKNVMKPKTH